MTGTNRGRAGSGKVKPVSDPADKGPAIPAGMRLLDGVPVPIKVIDPDDTDNPDGLEVHSAKWAAAEGLHARRTLLILADGSKTGGCADCVFTHPHWAAIIRHREDDHGAPHGARYSRKNKGDGADQLPLPGSDPPPDPPTVDTPEPDPAAENPVSAVPAGEGERRRRASGLEVVAAAIPDEIGGMTLREMLHHAGKVQHWQATSAHLVESRDRWKARALAAERQVARWEKAMAGFAAKFGFELKLPDEGEGEHGE